MNENEQTTWNQIVKTILTKSRDDFQTKVKPTLTPGRDKVGTVIETLGRRIRTETN